MITKINFSGDRVNPGTWLPNSDELRDVVCEMFEDNDYRISQTFKEIVESDELDNDEKLVCTFALAWIAKTYGDKVYGKTNYISEN